MSQQEEKYQLLSVEYQNLQKIMFKYKRENLELKRKLEERDEKIKFLNGLTVTHKQSIELERNKTMDLESVVQKQDAIITKLHRITKMFSDLTVADTKQKKFKQQDQTVDESASTLQNDSIKYLNDSKDRIDSIKERIYSLKKSSIGKLQTNKLPPLTSDNRASTVNENLSVLAMPLKNLKRVNEKDVASRILGQK